MSDNAITSRSSTTEISFNNDDSIDSKTNESVKHTIDMNTLCTDAYSIISYSIIPATDSSGTNTHRE